MTIIKPQTNLPHSSKLTPAFSRETSCPQNNLRSTSRLLPRRLPQALLSRLALKFYVLPACRAEGEDCLKRLAIASSGVQRISH